MNTIIFPEGLLHYDYLRDNVCYKTDCCKGKIDKLLNCAIFKGQM